MKNGNGNIELTPRTLVAVVAVALGLGAAGTGATWMFSGPAAADQSLEARVTVVERMQDEHYDHLKQELAEIKSTLKEIQRTMRRRETE